MQGNKNKDVENPSLHPRNKHQGKYNLKDLAIIIPELNDFIFVNDYNIETIDFFNPLAVKTLNKALLKYFYNIDWDIPKEHLCPPVPGRSEYIHYAADLLAESNNQIIPRGNKIKVLDVGTGANCIYPIIGNLEYGWSFVGSDIDSGSLSHAEKIINANIVLRNHIKLRHQKNDQNIFDGIIKNTEKFDLTICNPPFHSSLNEALSGTIRKNKNLMQKNVSLLNFSGKENELHCKGGELGFITRMIKESLHFADSCLWFTTLVSNKENLKSINYELNKVNANTIKTIEMKQGNKITRFVAWTYLNKEKQELWLISRFKV